MDTPRRALPSSLRRPIKRRRRNATAVLSGYFDPRPERDYFTDMANSSDSQSPCNSIIGRGPGILFDIRSQEEKDAELAREQKRLLKNAKRKERDLEKKREKEEFKFRKAQKRAERIQESAQAKSAQRIDEEMKMAPTTSPNSIFYSNPSGTVLPPVSFIRGAANQASPAVPAQLPTSQAGPSGGWSPFNTAPPWVGTSSSHGPLISGTRFTTPPTEPVPRALPARPEPAPAPTVRSLTISVAPPPSAAFPFSPPTPSRSIASTTSHASSKRPRTPDDDDMSLAHMHIDDQDAYNVYSSMDESSEIHMFNPDVLESAPGHKRRLQALSAGHGLPDPPSNVSAPIAPRTPPDPPEWITHQSRSRGARASGASQDVPSMTINPVYSRPTGINTGYPPTENNVVTSISHRRSALSVSTLTAQPSMFYTPSRSFAPAPPAPINPIVEETYIPRTDDTNVTVTAAEDQAPDSSVTASSTVDSSCLSPLAVPSPLVVDVVSIVPDELRGDGTEDSRERSPGDAVPAPLVEEPKQNTLEAFDPDKPDSLKQEGLGEFEDTAAHPTDHNRTSQHETSPTPEPIGRGRGRASKAMLVVESEEELTDLEDITVLSLSQCVVKTEPHLPRPASMSPPGAGAWRGQSEFGDGLSVPGSSTSPAIGGYSAAPRRRKRPAARKGWKGWVEVEVDDGKDLPPKRFSIEADIRPSLGERRTRSGRHFDG